MQTIEAIRKLYKIFKENNWAEKDIDEFVFNNFCTLFENLNDCQRALIVELTEKYSWISYAEYQSRVIKTLDSVDENKLNNLKRIYFFPIIKEEDEGKNKSGVFICYLIKGLSPLLKKYKRIQFIFPPKFSFFTNSDFELKNDEALFLVDDYIGSGETLESCLNIIQSNPKIKSSNINIITIVAQQEVSERVSHSDSSLYSNLISLKGITDFNSNSDRENKINIMLEIEKMIPGGNHFSLGYNQSEALVTMMRTPDNTFPIFWKAHRKDGKKYEAPFSREEY